MSVDLENRVKALEKHAEMSDDVHKEIMNRLNAKDISDAVKANTFNTIKNWLTKTLDEYLS